MLTYDQAVYFLETILRMPSTWKDLLKENPLEFLTLYMKRHSIRVPFQNMHMAAVEENLRWFPSEEELMNNGLSGRGGCCLHLNYFSKMVFKAIGLDTFVVRGDHYCAPVAGTHCMVMVRLHAPTNVTGVYMIEVGGAFPMLEPVPMDREKLPHKTLQAAGFPYEFREIAPGWVGKFHIGGGILGGQFTDEPEKLRTYWEMKPRAHWEFDYTMLETFTNPSVSVVLRAPAMIRFFSNTEFRRLFPELPENTGAKVKDKALLRKPQYISKTTTSTSKSKVTGGLLPASAPIQNRETAPLGSSLSNVKITESIEEKNETTINNVDAGLEEDDDLDDPKNFVFAFKRRIVVGDAHSRKIVKNYNSYTEMTEDLRKYFPTIPSDVVDKAIKTFSAYEPVATPFDNIL